MSNDEHCIHSFIDYDAYDAQVFQFPMAHDNATKPAVRKKSTSTMSMKSRKFSDPDLAGHNEYKNNTQPIPIPVTPLSPVDSPTGEGI